MSATAEFSPKPESQFLVYRSEDGKVKIDVRLEGENVWLSQQHMATLFQTTKQNISLHLQNVFAEGELYQDSVVKDSLTTESAGKPFRARPYNLDVILCVGYYLKSGIATLADELERIQPLVGC